MSVTRIPPSDSETERGKVKRTEADLHRHSHASFSPPSRSAQRKFIPGSFIPSRLSILKDPIVETTQSELFLYSFRMSSVFGLGGSGFPFCRASSLAFWGMHIMSVRTSSQTSSKTSSKSNNEHQ